MIEIKRIITTSITKEDYISECKKRLRMTMVAPPLFNIGDLLYTKESPQPGYVYGIVYNPTMKSWIYKLAYAVDHTPSQADGMDHLEQYLTKDR